MPTQNSGARMIEEELAAAAEFPGGAAVPLPQLIASAQRERATGKPPGAPRALFRHIATVLKAQPVPPVVSDEDATTDDDDDDALKRGRRRAPCRAVPCAPPRGPRISPGGPPPVYVLEDDGLDELSNSVLDLVGTGRFEDALAACRRRLEEFPDVVDGLERSGMVHAKMGNHALAADFYRKALDFVTHPSRRDDYDDADFYREQVEKEERLAGLC